MRWRMAWAAGAWCMATAAAGAEPEALQACARIEAAVERLACFDRLVPRPQQPAAAQATEAPPPAAAVPAGTTSTVPSLLGDAWLIGRDNRDSRFDIRPHRQSYFLLARHSDAPNLSPTSPSRAAPPPADLRNVEAKFQLSFKVKLADFSDPWYDTPMSLWAAYTQQSHWQVYNRSTSRPFRETNYEPEVMVAAFPDVDVLGMRMRLLALGFNHQSNGRAEPLSRSWNRIVGQIGLERGNFGLLIRPWWRIRESGTTDDNSDLTRYMGYGDVVGVYKLGEHSVSALARYRFATGYGALQLSWQFPLQRRVTGYVQLFSGYGESLIDYNVRQNTFGIGIALTDFL